ncbi:MAG: HD domain-containing protein [Clostridiales bacterium]|nr:HD domain-containing protein [Clostridiales bacterium]
MEIDRLEKQLAFLREADKAKSVFRNTILLDESRRENDAEHSWHMAVCAMLFVEYLNEPVPDMAKLMQMIILHDIIEIYSGDTFAYASADILSTRREREEAAADRIFSILPEDQAIVFRALWNEFEEGSSPESKCARLADAFMPLYHNYCTKGRKWRELGVTKDMVLRKVEFMKECSTDIYRFTCSLIVDAVDRGYLPE